MIAEMKAIIDALGIPTVPTRLDMIRQLPPDTEGAEIGVQQGAFSNEILQTPVKKLHLIDAWEHVPGHPDNAISLSQGGHDHNWRIVSERFDSEIAAGRVRLLRGFSTEAAIHFEPCSLDWIFLDADHTYEAVLADLIAWNFKIKPGGCIMGHDYMDWGVAIDLKFGVIRGVTEFCRDYGWKLTLLTSEDEWPSYRLEHL